MVTHGKWRLCLLFALTGAALTLGVTTALPIWEIPVERSIVGRWDDSYVCSYRLGTAWETVAGTFHFMSEYRALPCSDWQWHIFSLICLLLIAGAVLGMLVYKFVWRRLSGRKNRA
jgi:hypothetical protein